MQQVSDGVPDFAFLNAVADAASIDWRTVRRFFRGLRVKAKGRARIEAAIAKLTTERGGA